MQLNVQKYKAPAAGLAAGLILLAGLVFSLRRAPAPPQPKPEPKPVVAPEPPKPTEVTIPGRVEAVHTIIVSASVLGEIDTFAADVGDDVYEGQLVARIANKGLDTSLENAQRIVRNSEQKLIGLETAISAARLEAARAHTEATRAHDALPVLQKSFERQKLLFAAGATPRLQFEKAQKDFEATQGEAEGKAELAHQNDERVDALVKEQDLTRKTLDDKRKEMENFAAAVTATEVHAPAGGVVVARQGEIGKSLTQKDAAELFRIATDIATLQAVFPSDPSMKVGDAVAITFNDISGDPIQATIREIKSGSAIAEFKSPDPAIRPGAECAVHRPLK